AGKGEIYKVNLVTGERATVVTFDGTNGSYPYGDVVFRNQFLYGTTDQGGASDMGTVYRVDRSTGVLTTVISFDGAKGAYPRAGLVAFGSDLYGTASDGGERGFGGTIFKIDPATGVLTAVVSFASLPRPAGGNPISPLVVSGSFLYGTTYSDGANGAGTVFKFEPATGKLTTLTTGAAETGGYVYAGLVAAGSFLYGVSTLPGGDGSIFKVDPATGSVATILNFSGTNGSNPIGGLSFDGTYLYGTTDRDRVTGWVPYSDSIRPPTN